jgi:hypothetical protein
MLITDACKKNLHHTERQGVFIRLTEEILYWLMITQKFVSCYIKTGKN